MATDVKTKTAKTTTEASEPVELIAERTFVLNLTVGAIRGRNAKVRKEVVAKMARAIETEDPETVEDMADAGNELHVTKELLRVEEVDALVKELNFCRQLIRTNAIRFAPPKKKAVEGEPDATPPVSVNRILKEGMYVYSIAKVGWAEDRIKASRERVAALLDVIDARWPDIMASEEQRLRFRGLWDPRDYPTPGSIRACATITYAWLRFDVPASLARVNRMLFEQEKAKMREMWGELTDRVRLSYAATLESFVEKLRAALVPGENGKTKALRQDTIDNMTSFLQSFVLDDVTDYAELRALVDKAKATMRGIDAEVLRTEQAASDRVADAMTQIGEALKPLVVEGQRLVRLR